MMPKTAGGGQGAADGKQGRWKVLSGGECSVTSLNGVFHQVSGLLDIQHISPEGAKKLGRV